MDPILDFLLQPISGAGEHHIAFEHKWHARFMTLAWGVMIPTGIVVARYFKVTRRQNWPQQLDNQFWWVSHLALQIGGCLLSVIALWFVFSPGRGGGSVLAATHGVLGWSIVLLAASQLVGGALRGTTGHRAVVLDAELRAMLDGGDHYDMTLRRCVFEYAHKIVGYAALALAGVNILLGLALTDAPRWMWLVIAGSGSRSRPSRCGCSARGAASTPTRRSTAPREALPGNRRAPIGWGVRRYRADEWPPAPASRRH